MAIFCSWAIVSQALKRTTQKLSYQKVGRTQGRIWRRLPRSAMFMVAAGLRISPPSANARGSRRDGHSPRRLSTGGV